MKNLKVLTGAMCLVVTGGMLLSGCSDKGSSTASPQASAVSTAQAKSQWKLQLPDSGPGYRRQFCPKAPGGKI